MFFCEENCFFCDLKMWNAIIQKCKLIKIRSSSAKYVVSLPRILFFIFLNFPRSGDDLYSHNNVRCFIANNKRYSALTAQYVRCM